MNMDLIKDRIDRNKFFVLTLQTKRGPHHMLGIGVQTETTYQVTYEQCECGRIRKFNRTPLHDIESTIVIDPNFPNRTFTVPIGKTKGTGNETKYEAIGKLEMPDYNDITSIKGITVSE